MSLRRWPVILLLLLGFSFGLPGTVFAEGESGESAAPWAQAHEDAFLRGRDAYNNEDFAGARQAFIEAIQWAPERGESYRNLARTYYWLGDYAAAVAFYDDYLRLTPQASDLAEIQQERRSALSRADGVMWTLPSEQQMIRNAFLRELDVGRGITAGGGGAFGLFQALMRAGYASPQIREDRQRLEQKISAEFEAALVAKDAFIPQMRHQDWQMQAERLQALAELVRRPEQGDYLERRSQVVEALLMLLDGNYERAAHQAGQAALNNPDLPWISWYEIIAFSRAGRPQQALEALTTQMERTELRPQARERYEILRAHIYRQLGQNQEAARIYQELLLKTD